MWGGGGGDLITANILKWNLSLSFSAEPIKPKNQKVCVFWAGGGGGGGNTIKANTLKWNLLLSFSVEPTKTTSQKGEGEYYQSKHSKMEFIIVILS